MSATPAIIEGAEPWSSPGSGTNARVGVVVMHGFSGNPVSTRPLAEAIAAEGYTVELPRLPGHGTSWRDLARTRYPDWMGEAKRVVRDLRARSDHVVYVGFSVGGTLGLDLAADPGNGIDALVTINALVLDRTDPVAKLAPVLQYVVPVVPAKLAGIAPNDIAKGGDERAYPYVPSKAAYSLTAALPRIRAGMKNITLPILIAHSKGDHTVPPANSAAIAKAVASVDKTELTLERSFHVATLDHDAALLEQAVTDFIARVTD